MDLGDEEINGDNIPPFLRKPARGTREMDEMLLVGIDHRLAWLDSRGLRPHQNVLDQRENVMKRIGLRLT